MGFLAKLNFKKGLGMILDKLTQRHSYMGISPRVDKALDYLANTNLESLADGKYTILGDDVYALVQSYDTEEAKGRMFEAHRKYIDLQYVHSGIEDMVCAHIEDCHANSEYDAENDAQFFDLPDSASEPSDLLSVCLRVGWFILLFPQDAHVPGLMHGTSDRVRKIVVKIRV